MQKTLPKGHASCLSPEFTYTSATHTDLGKTFARIKRQLKGQSEQDRAKVCSIPVRIGARVGCPTPAARNRPRDHGWSFARRRTEEEQL